MQVQNQIIRNLALHRRVDIRDIHEAMYEICNRVHSDCDDECPVYEACGDRTPMENGNCKVFKDGVAMTNLLRELEGG